VLATLRRKSSSAGFFDVRLCPAKTLLRAVDVSVEALHVAQLYEREPETAARAFVRGRGVGERLGDSLSFTITLKRAHRIPDVRIERIALHVAEVGVGDDEFGLQRREQGLGRKNELR
jgi:hypothetical protein